MYPHPPGPDFHLHQIEDQEPPQPSRAEMTGCAVLFVLLIVFWACLVTWILCSMLDAVS